MKKYNKYILLISFALILWSIMDGIPNILASNIHPISLYKGKLLHKEYIVSHTYQQYDAQHHRITQSYLLHHILE